MVAEGLIKRIELTNAAVQKAFADTDFAEDDPEALEEPEALYLDLWIADIGIPSVARNLFPRRFSLHFRNNSPLTRNLYWCWPTAATSWFLRIS